MLKQKCFLIFLLYFFLLNCLLTTFSQNKSWFTDVTTHAGLDSIMNYFMYVSDVNNDNYPDILLEAGSQTPNQLRLFINIQNHQSTNSFDRIFREETESSGINPPGTIADLAGMADVNNDGYTDIVTVTYYYDRLPDCTLNPDNGARCEVLLNDGKGHFAIKPNNGLHELGPIPGSSLSFLDYDKDGNIDLFIGTHYSSWCETYGVEFPNYLMRGNGDGTFTDVSEKAGIRKTIRALFGSNIGDWNNDGWQDILTCPYEAEGLGDLFKNNGDCTFTDVSGQANYNPHFIKGDRGQGMVPWAAEPYDFDNDGDIDILFLLIHGGADEWEGRSSFFINQGKVNNYLLVPDRSRIVRKNPQSSHHGDNQGRFFDIDNDGLSDLAMSECVYKPLTDRLFIFRQDSTHTFIDITSELGFITDTSAASIDRRILSPHAIEPVDFDLDGDDDLLVAKYPVNKNFILLRNDIGNKNNWVSVKLNAPEGVNKSCIGARITLKSGKLIQMRDIYAGQGNFGAQQPFILTFGLGNRKKIDRIEVRWPDKNSTVTVVKNVKVNQLIEIRK
jgi:hypothetical protein